MRFAYRLPSSLVPAVLATVLVSDAHARPALGAGSGSCDGRIPIRSVPGSSGWRHVITEPGSYYFDGNVLGAAGVGGIRIDAAGVTLDFDGFALLGTDPQAGGAVSSQSDDVALVGGGLIRDWSAGVFLTGDRCRVEDLTVADTLGIGVALLGPDGAVRRCVIAGNGLHGIFLQAMAAGTSVSGCKLRDNDASQLLVECDGSVVEGCSIVANAALFPNPPLDVQGSSNVLRRNSVTLGQPNRSAAEVSGSGNRLLDNVVRLAGGATSAEGILVSEPLALLNEVRGGQVTVASTSSTAIRFDQPLNIIAVLIGLQPTADGSTGVFAGAPGHLARNELHLGAANATGVDVQGGTANVGTTLAENQIRVAGAGSTAVRSLASASIVQMSGIVLEPDAVGAIAIDVLGGPGGHHISENRTILAGLGQMGGILNGVGDLIHDEDILVLGDDCTAISKVSGSAGMIRDNRIRLAGANATGVFVSEFLGELVSHNVVIGNGDHYDVGEGNAPAQILANPGFGFVDEDVVNVQIGN